LFRTNALEGPEKDNLLTADGKVDKVFNGIPDWVYEEEVLGDNKAHYISSDGKKLAFAQFNDTLVPEFRYPVYGEPNDIYGVQYPEYK
jgi:dipeptidyl-peptidase 4